MIVRVYPHWRVTFTSGAHGMRVNFISHREVVGFTDGTAILTAAGQLERLSGVELYPGRPSPPRPVECRPTDCQ